MSPESLKIIANVVIALALFVLVALRVATLEQAITGVCLVLVPSGGAEIAKRVRDAFAAISTKKKDDEPPTGPSIVALAFVAVVGVTLEACFQSGKAPASSPPCADAGLSVDQCGKQYTEALTLCNATAKTRFASESCEEEARKYYGRPPLDGGAK